MLPISKLVKSQKKQLKKSIPGGRIEVDIRYDDECNNGHNTFAITGTIYEGRRYDCGGCIHDEIAKHFPELEKFIKWHLTSTDGPLHYIVNTMYHISEKDCWGLLKDEVSESGNITGEGKESDLEAARSCSIWPEANPEDFTKENLEARLPALMDEFQAAMIELGFEY